VNLLEFEQRVFDVALGSPICDIPTLQRLTATSVNLRIEMLSGGFIEAFFNERTGTTAFALIRDSQRIYGADNTGGWHVHPFADPARHVSQQRAMTFAQFVAEVERHESNP
jgi:hypothetical protein